MGRKSVTFFLASYLNGATSKRKNFAPLGEVDPLLEGSDILRKETEIVSLCKKDGCTYLL